MEGVYLDDLVKDYSTRLTYDELSDYGRYGKEFTFDDMVNRINKSIESDRKSTRLNSSHGYISYAVFCLERKSTRLNPVTATSRMPSSAWKKKAHV